MPRTDAGRGFIADPYTDDLVTMIDAIEAEAHAQGRAEALAAVRAAVEGMNRSPYFAAEGDDMCPNCATPWKCNGPHVAAKREPAGFEVDQAAVLAAIGNLGEKQ